MTATSAFNELNEQLLVMNRLSQLAQFNTYVKHILEVLNEFFNS